MPFKDIEVKRAYIRKYNKSYRKREGYKEHYDKYKTEWYRKQKEDDPQLYIWRNARYRASKKKIDFNLDKSDIQIPEVCPIFGFPLQINKGCAKEMSLS